MKFKKFRKFSPSIRVRRFAGTLLFAALLVAPSACSHQPALGAGKPQPTPSSAVSSPVSSTAPKLVAPPAALLPAPLLHTEKIDPRQAAAGAALLEAQYAHDPTPGKRFLTQYLQAQLWAPTDPARACRLWLQTLKEPAFPLREVASLRALETCTEEPPHLTTITTPAPWLQELRARVALKRALLSHDTLAEMNLSYDVAAFEKVQRDRVRLLKRSLEIATAGSASTPPAATGHVSVSQLRLALEKAAPRFIQNPQADQLLLVAGDFKQAREFVQAKKAYQTIIHSPLTSNQDKLRAYDGIRQIAKLQKGQAGQNTASFLKATAQYAAFSKSKFFGTAPRYPRAMLKLFFDAHLVLARAVWTEHNPTHAKEILTRLEKDVKGRYPVDESLWVRSRIAEESGDLNEVLKILSAAKPDKIEDHDLRLRILWTRAWALRKAGRTAEAIPEFQQLAREDQSFTTLMRAHYWLARTLKESAQGGSVSALAPAKAAEALAAAQTEYEWLIDNDPMGYYGLLAYRDLKRPMPSAQVAVATPSMPGPSSVRPALEPSIEGADRQLAEWLIAAGEKDLARVYLDQITIGKRRSFNESQAVDLLQLYARAGSYQTLFTRLSELSNEMRKKILETNPELIFPQPWHPLALEAAARFAVPVELIYGIMRQESSFNPTARSGADAFGLMQLIPEMAHRASVTAGVQLTANEDLYLPEVNIPLGAAFIHELMKHWNGQFVLTVASYNANQHVIASWVKTRFTGDPVQFIEDIPYDETRTYIKLVLRNYIFYSRLNLDATHPTMLFPEQCLENLQAVKL
jgi:soluble lytic murein transglycosylase